MYGFDCSKWDGGTPSNRGPETTKVVERRNHQPLLHRQLVRTRCLLAVLAVELIGSVRVQDGVALVRDVQ